ncbi:MAG TPA: PilZ domain-containing protein [Pyrinomonadaceae bacterium]|nr:PilZ domain-containing protein [Pyrinomonadaceae bacterium]
MQCEQRANYTLEHHLPITEATFRSSRSVFERRAKPRSDNKMIARVWGVDSDDQPFSLDCVLDNISASGLYVRLPRRMKFFASISLVVRLPNAPVNGRFAAINGKVVRDQIEHDGHTGLAVKIVEHSFI